MDATPAGEKWFGGLGGWLILPLLLLIAIPVTIALQAWSRLKTHSPVADFHAMAGNPLFLGLAAFAALLIAAIFLLGIFCLVQFLRKKEALPRLIQIWFVLSIVLNVVVAIQYAIDQDLFNTVIDPSLTPGQERIRVALNIFVSGLWYLYFGLSKRVNKTFVH